MSELCVLFEADQQSKDYIVSLCRLDHADPPRVDLLAQASIPHHLNMGTWQVHGLPTPNLDRLSQALRMATPGSQLLDSIGAELWRLLHSSDVGKALAAACASEPAKAHQILLSIVPPELQALPWELLFDAGNRTRLFMSQQLSFERGPSERPPWKRPPPLSDWPLRVLAVNGFSATERGAFAREELDVLRRVCLRQRERIDLEILENPTRDELFEALKLFRPHVLHLLCHGAALGDTMALVLDLPDGESPAESYTRAPTKGGGTNRWEWNVDAIVHDMKELLPDGERPLRLVYLNVCQSSVVHPQLRWSIANAFLRSGAAAVIGMQGDIDGKRAVEFTRSFYSQLDSGKSLDAMMGQARGAVARSNGGFSACDWALPCLHLSCAPASILPPLLLKSGMPWRSIARRFVNRRAERRALIHLIQSPQRQPRLLMIKGLPKVGKSALLQFVLHGLMRRGQSVHYVDLSDTRKLGVLEFLRLFRDGHLRNPRLRSAAPEAVGPRPRSLPHGDFAEFNAAVNALLRDETVAAPPMREAGDAYAPLHSTDARLIEQLLCAFKRALSRLNERADREGRWLIVLDSIGQIEPSAFHLWIKPHLFRELINGTWPNLLCLLVTTPADWSAFDLADLLQPESEAAALFEVEPISCANPTELLWEFCHIHDWRDRLRGKPVEQESLQTVVKNLGVFLKQKSADAFLESLTAHLRLLESILGVEQPRSEAWT